MQIKASISILLFSFGADPLYRRSPRLSRPLRFRRPRWPFSFDLIKVEHSIVCFKSVVPSSIRASRHDHDKLGHRHRMVAFSSLNSKRRPCIRRLSNNAPHNVQQTTAEESKWSGTHCMSRTKASSSGILRGPNHLDVVGAISFGRRRLPRAGHPSAERHLLMHCP